METIDKLDFKPHFRPFKVTTSAMKYNIWRKSKNENKVITKFRLRAKSYDARTHVMFHVECLRT